MSDVNSVQIFIAEIVQKRPIWEGLCEWQFCLRNDAKPVQPTEPIVWIGQPVTSAYLVV